MDLNPDVHFYSSPVKVPVCFPVNLCSEILNIEILSLGKGFTLRECFLVLHVV